MSAITSTSSRSPAVMQAEKALAQADAAVDADKAAHSPDCVAVDEKRVRRAEIQLSEASGDASSGSRALSITV